MILNKTYYQKLLESFKDVQHLENDFSNNVVALTVKIILKHYYDNKPLHINFQNAKDSLFEVAKNLYIELSNEVYLNHYDLPSLAIGNKLRDKRKYRDGKKHDFIIIDIKNEIYVLEHLKQKYPLPIKYDFLVKNFIPIQQGTRQATLIAYTKYFSDLNKGLKLEFTPTNFEKKIVFIAKKPLWEFLSERSKIPSVYLPNPNDGNDIHPIKSIPALSDCLCYFTPKYNLCYDNLLLKKVNIKTIVVFDTEAINIQQMLLDKQRFEFNLIILSNSLTPQKNNSIPCWNWFKEEVELVNTL